MDGEGWPRADDWRPGRESPPPALDLALLHGPAQPGVSGGVRSALTKAEHGELLTESDIVELFQARREDFTAVCRAADDLRRDVNGDIVSYVVTRNINYTNICSFKCQFCAFSKGKLSENLRGRPYDLELSTIADRAWEAWERGATEVCMQGGIHPSYTGRTYLDICRAVRERVPGIHVHAFSPLEVFQGAKTLGTVRVRVSRRAEVSGARHASGNGGRDSRRRGRASSCVPTR